jgi:hypothetical protein
VKGEKMRRRKFKKIEVSNNPIMLMKDGNHIHISQSDIWEEKVPKSAEEFFRAIKYYKKDSVLPEYNQVVIRIDDWEKLKKAIEEMIIEIKRK